MPKQLAIGLFALGLAFAAAAFVIFGMGDAGLISSSSSTIERSGQGSPSGSGGSDSTNPLVGDRPHSDPHVGTGANSKPIDTARGTDGQNSTAPDQDSTDSGRRNAGFGGGIRDIVRRPGSDPLPDRRVNPPTQDRETGEPGSGTNPGGAVQPRRSADAPADDGDQTDPNRPRGRGGIRNPQLPPTPQPGGNPGRPSTGSGSGGDSAPPTGAPGGSNDNKTEEVDQTPDPRSTPPTKARFSTPATVILTNNASVVIPVTYTAPIGTAVASLQFDVHYPADVLRHVGQPQLANFGEAGKEVSANEVSPGLLRVIVFGVNQRVIPTGASIQLSFSATRPSSQWTGALTLSAAAASNAEAKGVDSEVFGSTLRFEE